jgi:hypothetical protein
MRKSHDRLPLAITMTIQIAIAAEEQTSVTRKINSNTESLHVVSESLSTEALASNSNWH